MVHLADPDAEEKVFELQADEEFLKFIDQYPVTEDAKISFLLKKGEGQIFLRTF